MIPHREVPKDKGNHLSQGKNHNLHRALLERENRSVSVRTLRLYRVPQRVRAALPTLNPGQRRADRAALHPPPGRGQEPSGRDSSERQPASFPTLKTPPATLRAAAWPLSPSAPPALSARRALSREGHSRVVAAHREEKPAEEPHVRVEPGGRHLSYVLHHTHTGGRKARSGVNLRQRVRQHLHRHPPALQNGATEGTSHAAAACRCPRHCLHGGRAARQARGRAARAGASRARPPAAPRLRSGGAGEAALAAEGVGSP